MSSRIVFIDSLIVDYQSLIPQIPSDSEIVVLDRDKDGVTQILAALRSRFELDAIDIISHGTPGALMLGSGELNRANLASYAEQLTEIGTHLSDSGDILLYGCEVAKGNVGQRFIEQLAQLTGANVAASTHLTGAKDLGGDWVLGAQSGTIASRTLQLSYDGVLAGEFRVNTYTANVQSYSSITALANGGGFVVSWQSYGQDGDDYGIYAQRYDANWVLQGNEFKVNTYTTNDQSHPSITALSNGGFVVSWDSYDGNDDGVYAQRYDANGNPIDGIVQVRNAPSDINLSNRYVNENSPIGTQIGTLTSTDADNTTGFTYKLVDGLGDADNASFIIDGDKLLLDAAVNYEAKHIYSFHIKTTDESGLSYEEGLSILIFDANDVPTGAATGTLANGVEDTVYPVLATTLLKGFSDEDVGDTLSVNNLSSTKGTFATTANGWNFTPVKGYNGPVTFTYQVSDGVGGVVDGVTRTFDLLPVKGVLKAGDDQVKVLEDASVTVGFDALLANDFDPTGSKPTIIGIDTAGTKSSVSINTNNRTITYNADADVFDLLATGNTATDSFKYTLQGSTGEKTTGTVQINVQGINDGNPNLLGTVKADTLNGTTGEDRIKGNNGNDILNGGDGADDLFGDNGDDTLNGGNSIDNLFGGNGNDRLNGGNGNDWLGGERGNDTLTGGLGNDVFLFAKSGGNDIITDFANGFDKIQIAADTGKTNFGQLTIIGGTDANGTAYTTINLGSGGQATLIGVSVADVDAADFIFPV